jgi:hypothetical protein
MLTRCAFGGRSAIHVGTIALALFIRSVFHPQSRWALACVLSIAICLLGGIAGSGWVGDWLGERPFDTAWYWPELVADIAPSAWMAAEGMLSHQNAKKRLRLGLCDAQDCNRFLLWGLAGAVWAGLEIVSFAREMELELTGRFSTLTDLLMGACEFVPVVLVWLAFFPPVAYRKRFAGRADPASATR